MRKYQQARDKQSLGLGVGSDDLETAYSSQERQLLQNRRHLEEAKMAGYEMEDMANDIKYNLRN